MSKRLTKEEALAKIEELKKFVADADVKETKKVGIKINHWNGISVVYESTKETLREAVIEAVESDADLRGADLRDADLRGADLSDADLSDADLSGADLSDAILRGADLSGADLRGAILRGAELNFAKFYGRGGTKPLKRSQLPDFLAALGFVIEG